MAVSLSKPVRIGKNTRGDHFVGSRAKNARFVAAAGNKSRAK